MNTLYIKSRRPVASYSARYLWAELTMNQKHENSDQKLRAEQMTSFTNDSILEISLDYQAYNDYKTNCT